MTAVSPATEWLMRQVGPSPPELIQTMLSVLSDSPGRSVADVLAEGAMALYATSLSGTGGREDALALLAADALFTHAFQAQAELDADGLPGYLTHWTDGARLAALLDGLTTPPR